MKRLVLIAALGGACGATTDDRPRTLEYITDTILAPTCASAACHSAFKQELGDAFDSVENARLSIMANSLVDITSPKDSTIYKSITEGVQGVYSGVKSRMPYDAPMPDADVALILDWIQKGAEGAQCLPNAQGLGCSVTVDANGPRYHIVKCVDGNVGDLVMDCPGMQVCSVPTGNATCVP